MYFYERMYRRQKYICKEGRKEGNILFNDALNTFYLRLYDVTHIVKVFLYASSHRQDNTYHGL